MLQPLFSRRIPPHASCYGDAWREWPSSLVSGTGVKGEDTVRSRLHRSHCTFASTSLIALHVCINFTDCTPRLQVRTNEEMSRAGSAPNTLGSDAQYPGKQSLSFTVTTGESLQRLLAERRGSGAAAADDFAASIQSPCQVIHPSPVGADSCLGATLVL